MIVGIDHVQITVPAHGVAAARAFYCGLLGLPEVEKPEALRGRGGFWLQVGNRQVHVGTEDGVERRATKAHVAYAVRDLEAWRGRLAAAGVKILNGVPIPGFERFEFRDPFGNRVEFIQAVKSNSPVTGID
jgi:catechol 2,3-dioxygenase-like lactoylglutathione lyase family enzyme